MNEKFVEKTEVTKFFSRKKRESVNILKNV